MDVKLAADTEGKLTAYCNDMLVDNGAYHSMGHVVVNRALMMLSGSYHIPNLKADSRLVYTNNPWGAAARGAGAPQANFALEVAMEMLADKVGADSLEFRFAEFPGARAKQVHRPGGDRVAHPRLMEAIRPHYDRAKKEAAAAKDGRYCRGVGLATGSFGIGHPGRPGLCRRRAGQRRRGERVRGGGRPGRGQRLHAQPDHGRDDRHPLEQGAPLHPLHRPDRSLGPGGRQPHHYMIGGAAEDALKQLKVAMDETGATTAPELEAAGKPARYQGTKKLGNAGVLDPETGQGPPWSPRCTRCNWWSFRWIRRPAR